MTKEIREFEPLANGLIETLEKAETEKQWNVLYGEQTGGFRAQWEAFKKKYGTGVIGANAKQLTAQEFEMMDAMMGGGDPSTIWQGREQALGALRKMRQMLKHAYVSQVGVNLRGFRGGYSLTPGGQMTREPAPLKGK